MQGVQDGPATLAAAIANGDRAAEQRLVELYGKAVAIILERQTRGGPEAEDLFQDTFRVALEKLRHGELRDGNKLPGFLARIARNLAIEHYRKLGRRKTEADSEKVLLAQASEPGPLDTIVDEENAALVRRLLSDLGNGRDREILFRFYVADEDKERIAEDLDLSSLQFNRVLHRARGRYKTLCREKLPQLLVLLILKASLFHSHFISRRPLG